MDQQALKHDFAANMLRFPADPFKAAFHTTADTGLALQIAKNWENDPIVLAEMDKILGGSDAKSFLPSKEMQAREIHELAVDERVAVEDRLKAHRLYAEVMGFIEKPSQGNTTNILNQGVMVVRDAGSDEDWQTKAVAQQRTLTGHASSVN